MRMIATSVIVTETELQFLAEYYIEETLRREITNSADVISPEKIRNLVKYFVLQRKLTNKK